MRTYFLAYRHENGRPEGFSGFSFFGLNQARRNAIKKIVAKCKSMNQPFQEHNIIEQNDEVTILEKYLIKLDWEA